MIIYTEWFEKYMQTIVDIFGKSIDHNSNISKGYFDNGQDPVWSALIYIQENIKSFSFEEWTAYVDYVIKLIINKDSSEIEDQPYYELWDKLENPLVVALYAIFQSSEELDDTHLPNDAKIIWLNSKYNTEIKTKIESILAKY